jgi:hypothetical protein
MKFLPTPSSRATSLATRMVILISRTLRMIFEAVWEAQAAVNVVKGSAAMMSLTVGPVHMFCNGGLKKQFTTM